MSRLARLTVYLTSTVAAFAWGYSAHAADLLLVPEPMAEADVPMAVSAVNGKWELDIGSLASTRPVNFASPDGSEIGWTGQSR